MVCIPKVVFNPKLTNDPASTFLSRKGVFWLLKPKLELVCVPPSNLYSRLRDDSVYKLKFISLK